MKITPLKHYASPAFPTADILKEHPELLRIVPRRWQNNPIVLSTLFSLCTMLSTCRTHAPFTNYSTTNTPSVPTVFHLAPLFPHGNGRASFACDAIAPALYLSEDEASTIINEEAAKAGIHFTNQPEKLIPGLPQPLPLYVNDPIKRDKYNHTFIFDGVDNEHNIAYKFVSISLSRYRDKNNELMNSLSFDNYDSVYAATGLLNKIQNATQEGTVAIFYEPFENNRDQNVENNSNAKKKHNKMHKQVIKDKWEIEREQLRLQVRDFIAWLKTEGII